MVGEIRLFGGRLTASTTFWLICDGSQISRITCSRLCDIIENLYGATGNETTFMLPDFRGRVPVGVDSSRMRAGGAINLVTSTVGAHSHTITDPGHNHGGHTQAATSISTSWRHGDSLLQLKHHNDYTVKVDSPHVHAIPIGHTGISVDTASRYG
ncbi:unnamed protein product [Rotaria socialis]|uniref:Phage tail collar domain-containing protein n=1 Tax=Rotaria socialis TaxID=392032 RepID=A0A820VEQ9_9BILA|nr:unnamed protein product [Rotaria socialis]CAF3657794.1 unnamed protein product [Rotaria socialis]CAF4127496.1 unnamed protein product [Rotaria socialis]CAF4500116.1 unnamed protein product [Rotaria socialis]